MGLPCLETRTCPAPPYLPYVRRSRPRPYAISSDATGHASVPPQRPTRHPRLELPRSLPLETPRTLPSTDHCAPHSTGDDAAAGSTSPRPAHKSSIPTLRPQSSRCCCSRQSLPDLIHEALLCERLAARTANDTTRRTEAPTRPARKQASENASSAVKPARQQVLCWRQTIERPKGGVAVKPEESHSPTALLSPASDSRQLLSTKPRFLVRLG